MPSRRDCADVVTFWQSMKPFKLQNSDWGSKWVYVRYADTANPIRLKTKVVITAHRGTLSAVRLT